MKHIPSDVLAKIKADLLKKKEKLLSVRKEVELENPAGDEDRLTNNASPDADAREEVQMLASEVVGTEVDEMLTRVDAALQRMERGTYGVTADGKDIPVERLLVDPTATTLVH
jgi:RNA polymerase-binding transcription factor DksA